MKLIESDALIAEIKKIYAEEKAIFDEQCRGGYEPSPSPAVVCMKMEHLLSFINTLEVKEVDLEKHLKEDIEDVFFDLNGVAVKGATHYLTVEDVKDIAKHFFELGTQYRGE